ncbi:MAG TPA: MMPL family transporter [Nocardioidaceae bacterium]|nr:MMPL family transporter [Nocardioidaceae bacterium]
MLTRWGRLVARRARWVVTVGMLLVVAASAFGFGVFDKLQDGGFDDPASESAQAADAEQDAFGRREADLIAIYSSDSLTVGDPAFEQAVRDTLAGLPEDSVANVVTWYDTPQPSLVSSDRHATQVVVSLTGDTQNELSESADEVRPALEDVDGLTVDVAGQYAVFGDVSDNVSEDIARAESISMPLVLILCLVIFGSIVAALMPVGIGAVAVVGSFAIVRLLTSITDVSVFAINIITLLGMGLAIDYALFVVSRFREELAKRPGSGRDGVAEAVETTVATAGRTILFSGLTVAAALASLLIFPQIFLRSMSMGGIAAVLVAMVAALTVLPATLALLGRRIEAGRMPWRRRRSPQALVEHGTWARIARSVMRRPVAYLVTIVVALLALGTPFLGAAWGSVDERVLPEDAPSRIAAEKQADLFGGEQSSANALVTGASESELSGYVADLGQVDGVDGVRVLDQTTEDGNPVALVQATWEGNGQTEESQSIVSDLRGVQPPGDADVLIGGTSANTVDLIDSVGERLPWMGLLVVAVMLVLLFLAFGSIVLPIKAVVMNAVSIVASFGVVTWIFADGHLSGLLGFTSTGYLDATQPILMLAILFGLSMDYEVFLLSRVRERWDATHDNTDAVATGVQQTGGIITSAALLLAVVIGAFATSGIVFIKMIGVGMLVAILVDATVVRALLVPATMRLLGRANWWAPGPMRRWWERHGIREVEAPEAPRERSSILVE